MGGMGCQRCFGCKSISPFANASVCECPSRLITREKLEVLRKRVIGLQEVGIRCITLTVIDAEALIDFCEEELGNRENE